jgi:dTDP-4-amino-4,6-dideoxygalactose transaminase
VKIEFNKPYISGQEIRYIKQAIATQKISGNGYFTKKCQSFFEETYGFSKCLLTTSCTDALEMAAMLINIVPGDEVIIPSYTFVSTALAFIRQGAKIVFADSHPNHPGIDESFIEGIITKNTKAIVVMHYAGVACDMDMIMNIACKHKLFVIEDAALSIDSYYRDKPLGGIGHLGCFSFHETKNIQCGEGGLLAINHKAFEKRAEVIWEKGTNRAEFHRGKINKYGWVDVGSSFLPNEITAAFLYGQLMNISKIQKRRKIIWNKYYKGLIDLAEQQQLRLPYIPDYSSNNAHTFYFLCKSRRQRDMYISKLKQSGIQAVFHYLSLHSSEYYQKKHDGRNLPFSDYYSNCLIRLPIYYNLTAAEQKYIIQVIHDIVNG